MGRPEVLRRPTAGLAWAPATSEVFSGHTAGPTITLDQGRPESPRAQGLGKVVLAHVGHAPASPIAAHCSVPSNTERPTMRTAGNSPWMAFDGEPTTSGPWVMPRHLPTPFLAPLGASNWNISP